MYNLQQTIEALRASFDKMAPTYDSANDTLGQRVHAYVNRKRILEVMSKRQIRTVLDAGGGTGTWAVLLAEAGYEVTLVDVSPLSVRVAAEKARARNLQMTTIVEDVEQTELASESFDFILSQGLLSYTPRPQVMLREMRRLLKPDGLFWVEFYNARGWAIENADLAFKIRMATATEELVQMSDWDYPARLFSIERVRAMCSDARLRVLGTYGSYTVMASIPHERAYVHQIDETVLEQLQAVELDIGARPDCVGMSKSVQFLATPI